MDTNLKNELAMCWTKNGVSPRIIINLINFGLVGGFVFFLMGYLQAQYADRNIICGTALGFILFSLILQGITHEETKPWRRLMYLLRQTELDKATTSTFNHAARDTLVNYVGGLMIMENDFGKDHWRTKIVREIHDHLWKALGDDGLGIVQWQKARVFKEVAEDLKKPSLYECYRGFILKYMS